MQRVDAMPDRRFKALRPPAYLTDINKPANWGLLNGQPVVCDYGQSHTADSLGMGLSCRQAFRGEHEVESD